MATADGGKAHWRSARRAPMPRTGSGPPAGDCGAMKIPSGAGDSEQAVARFVAQFSTTTRAEAIHLALQALRARVEPDRVLACELAWEVPCHGHGVKVAEPTG